jgi:signal transduction histidine kinase
MKNYPLKYFVLLFFNVINIFFFNNAFPQEKGLIQSKLFTSKEYRAGTQNWAIVEDHRGVMYFGNGRGVLEYNGETWNLIKLKNESSVRSLAVSKNGTVYVGGFNELGYLQPNSIGELSYISLTPLINELLPIGEVWDINCFGDTVFFLSDRFIIRFINGKHDYWESESKSFYLSFSINNEYYVQELGVGLMKFGDNNFKLIENGDYFSGIKIHSIFPHKMGLLIGSRSDGFFLYSSQNGNVKITPLDKVSDNGKKINDYFKNHSFYHGISLTSNLNALGSITGNILIVNQNWEVVDVINHETIGVNSPTLYLYLSKQQSLWLALDNGICLVEVLSPFRYWNENTGYSGVITDIARIENFLYISTASGIFYTANSEDTNFRINDFARVDGDFEQSWEFLYFKKPEKLNSQTGMKLPSNQEQNILLLAATRKGLFNIIGSKSQRISRYDALLSIYQSSYNPSNLFVGLSSGLAKLSFSNGKWIDEGKPFGLESRINDIAEDSLGNLWLTSNHTGIYRIKNPHSSFKDSIQIDFFDTNHGIPNLRYMWIVDQRDPLLFYIDSEYYFFCDSTSTFKQYVFPKVVENENNETSNESIAWARMWENVITELYVTHIGDSIPWFGGNSGVFRYKKIAERDYSFTYPTHLRLVSTGDSVLFYGANIEFCATDDLQKNLRLCVSANPIVDLGTILKYKDNSLTFYYSSLFYEGDKPVEFAFWLDGYDTNWSDWSTETKKEYTNLPPGKYRFKVKSRNLYFVESTAAEFVFEVLPPWYLTLYAFIGYVLVLGLLVFVIVRAYTYRLIIEKDKLEELVKERTQEILIQKEEILVQSEHLKDANDWISAKNQELEEQKRVIEQKKDQLEISNATKNKFFRIIAHDLRNPISTVVGTTSHILSNFELSDTKTTKKLLEDMSNLSMTTYNLLENLLDWSTSQMGEIRYNPTTIEVRSIITQNIELVKSKIESKCINLVLQLTDDIVVFADENMIQTVVRNLISNAVKFTYDNGTIEISARVVDDICLLSFKDTGIGISKENIENLYRIDKDVRTYGTHNEKGAGLGLILCKEFIEINGGKINVASTPQKGTEFIITLQVAKS